MLAPVTPAYREAEALWSRPALVQPHSVAPPQLRTSCDTGAPKPPRAPLSEAEWYSQWMVVVREETAAPHMRG